MKCTTKIERVKKFLTRCRETLVRYDTVMMCVGNVLMNLVYRSAWWKHSSEEEIEVAMHVLERNLFIHIHDWVFAVSEVRLPSINYIAGA